jgi:hypothetical protein
LSTSILRTSVVFIDESDAKLALNIISVSMGYGSPRHALVITGLAVALGCREYVIDEFRCYVSVQRYLTETKIRVGREFHHQKQGYDNKGATGEDKRVEEGHGFHKRHLGSYTAQPRSADIFNNTAEQPLFRAN